LDCINTVLSNSCASKQLEADSSDLNLQGSALTLWSYPERKRGRHLVTEPAISSLAYQTRASNKHKSP